MDKRCVCGTAAGGGHHGIADAWGPGLTGLCPNDPRVQAESIGCPGDWTAKDGCCGACAVARRDHAAPAARCRCGVMVRNGINGDAAVAPWAARLEACCYACDNAAMMDAEREHAVAIAEAAWRAGRGDLV